MRVGFVIAIFSTLALAQDCPDNPPIICGTDQMVCHGGFDPAGCPMPDTCTPMTGEYQKNEQLGFSSKNLSAPTRLNSENIS